MTSHKTKNSASESSKAISTTFQKVITPRTAIAADFIRIVFNDCQWRNDYGPMIKLLLVCKDWFNLASSLLYRKVTINLEAAAEKFLQTISSPERGHLYKRCLRSLDAREQCNFRSKTSEQWVRSVCTCLETGAPLFSDLDGWFWRMDSFVDTIGPNLRRQLEGLTIYSLRGEELQSFPNLKRLYSHTEYTDPSIFVNFIAFAPQLTRISIWLHRTDGLLSVRVLESLVNIEDLQITFDTGEGIDNEHLILDDAFCRAFKDPMRIFLPKLTSLNITANNKFEFWWSTETVFAFFRRIRKTLTTFELDMNNSEIMGATLGVLSYTGDQQNRKNYVLRELELPFMPVDWMEINFANFKALESIHIERAGNQAALKKIANSFGETLRRFSFNVKIDDRTSTGQIENYVSTMKQFKYACPHLEELKLEFGFGTGVVIHFVGDMVAHPRLRVLRVIDDFCFCGDRKRMMTKIWSQCPDLYNIFWNGVCYGRYQ